MSLSLLKTRDLSRQDHTVNVELMLSPHRSHLLFNKHKTLDTRYSTEVDLYEKQASFLLKDLAVERRVLERYRSQLVSRQKELVVQRSQSAQETRKVELITLNERSRSAPTGCARDSSPNRYEGRKSRGVFLTEIDEDKATQLPWLAYGMSKSKTWTGTSLTHSPSAFKNGYPNIKRKYVNTFKKKNHVTFGVCPPSESPVSELLGSAEKTEVKVTMKVKVKVKNETNSLDVKIKNFLDEVEAFNEKPSLPKLWPGSIELFDYLKQREKSYDWLVAKRYDTFTIDKQRLEVAFDNFCKNNSREDLVHMMHLATKMKANVAQARNTSVIPTIATIKSSRAFLSLRPPMAAAMVAKRAPMNATRQTLTVIV